VCLGRAVLFSLVCREKTALADHPSRTLQRLRGWCVEEREVSEWPGTVLIGHSARLYLFEASPEAIEVLCEGVDGLFGWLGPDEPEDLAFYRRDGSVFLESIAHEKDARLYLSQEEWERLSRLVRELLTAC
jgi:hypothetical protein